MNSKRGEREREREREDINLFSDLCSVPRPAIDLLLSICFVLVGVCGVACVFVRVGAATSKDGGGYYLV